MEAHASRKVRAEARDGEREDSGKGKAKRAYGTPTTRRGLKDKVGSPSTSSTKDTATGGLGNAIGAGYS